MRRQNVFFAKTCPPHVVAILLQEDVVQILFELLPAKGLLLCALVCRTFLQHIDRNTSTFFNKYLRWWSVFDASASNEPNVCFNALTQQYEQLHTVRPAWQLQWLTRIVPRVGVRVQMRMHLLLELDHVQLSGKAADVAKIQQQMVTSVDALEWEVMQVLGPFTPSSVCRGFTGNVVMQLVSYVHNVRTVSLKILQNVVVTFEQVPVLQRMLSHRELCVVASVRQCMHCHVRVGRWKSVDVQHADHRVLCTVCLDEIYAEESKVYSKWKIKLPAASDMHRCFFMHENTMSLNMKKARMRVCVLKQDVLKFAGFKSFSEMLQRAPYSMNKGLGRLARRAPYNNMLLSTRWF